MKRTSAYIGALLTLIALIAAYAILSGSTTDPAQKEIDTIAGLVHSDVTYVVERDPDVPELPFDDNPDPAQCGIPVKWGSDGQAWLTGIWNGQLLEPDVLMYDSHLRTKIVDRAPHGTEVEIVLFQQNPTLDFYFVRVAGPEPREGWVPSPFISLEPVA